MSATNVGVGDTVKVDVLIPDGGSGLYPQATLIDASNAALGVSPLNLTHVAGDLYSATFTMPNTQKVTATTIVYTDSGHTTPDTDYEPTIDEYVKSPAVDAGTIADAVWDEPLAGHVTAGTSGANQNLIDNLETETDAATRASNNQSEHDATQAAIAAISIPTPPTVGAIADAVWDEAKAGHVAAGSFGLELGTSQAEHDATQTAIAGALSGVLAALTALEASIKGADDLDLTLLGGSGFNTSLHSLVALRSEIDGLLLTIQAGGDVDIEGVIDDEGDLEGQLTDADTLVGVLDEC